MGYPLIMIVRAQQLHATPLAIGLLFATGGMGGIAGAVVAPWFQGRYRTGSIMIAASWVWVVTWIPYALAPTLVWLGVANVVGWLIIPIHTVTQTSYRLASVPDALQGRVNAVYKLIAFGGQPLSYALTGLLLQEWGPVSTVWLIMLPQVAVTVLATANAPLRRAPRLADVVSAR
jgi:predicted MFS family arabinose efflux permease